VTTESGKTIADAPGSLAWSVGHRVKSIAHVFEAASKRADTLGLNAEQYCFAL
jgi:hypothetical protein